MNSMDQKLWASLLNPTFDREAEWHEITKTRKAEYDHAVRNFWNDIACRLAPENLHEDGEISNKEAERKRDHIYRTADVAFSKGYWCPDDIADNCDDDLQMYKQTQTRGGER